VNAFCPLASAGSLKPIPDVEVRKKLLRRSDEQRAVTREGAKAEAGRGEGDELWFYSTIEGREFQQLLRQRGPDCAVEFFDRCSRRDDTLPVFLF
jgi:hypothetical protein